MTLFELFCAFVSAIVLSVVCVTHPRGVSCPDGFWLPEGVRASGDYACRPLPVGGHDASSGFVQDTSVVPAGELRGRVYCESGWRAGTIDGRSVTCLR